MVRGARDRRPAALFSNNGSGSCAAGCRDPPPPCGRPRPSRSCSACRAAAWHVDAVAACRERIAAGEIFQANLCLRLDSTWDGGAAALSATALERISPPYAAMFDTPNGSVASLSPELFLRRRGDQVLTAPIKGTIARTGDPDVDKAALERLRGSAKDAAEHVMIVDLMRNDIGRVCEYGSVVAPRLPTPEAHPGLWHLVSHVRGTLRPQTSNAALLRATFPPGSVTGAPKVQSLRVIAELERTAREVYTGSIGYCSPIAGLELNVAIRTLELRDGRLWIGAGGGIVADSDPRSELDEAIAKARPIAAAVGADVVVSPRVRRQAGHRRPPLHRPGLDGRRSLAGRLRDVARPRRRGAGARRPPRPAARLAVLAVRTRAAGRSGGADPGTGRHAGLRRASAAHRRPSRAAGART